MAKELQQSVHNTLIRACTLRIVENLDFFVRTDVEATLLNGDNLSSNPRQSIKHLRVSYHLLSTIESLRLPGLTKTRALLSSSLTFINIRMKLRSRTPDRSPQPIPPDLVEKLKRASMSLQAYIDAVN